MHPVFVAAVKRNEVGVAPAPFSLASVPGTIPATVRPPRIPRTGGCSGRSCRHAGAAAWDSNACPDGDCRASTLECCRLRIPAICSAACSHRIRPMSPIRTKRQEGGPIDQITRLIGLSNNDATDPAEAAPFRRSRRSGKPMLPRPAQLARSSPIPSPPRSPKPRVQCQPQPPWLRPPLQLQHAARCRRQPIRQSAALRPCCRPEPSTAAGRRSANQTTYFGY
jgi:hypothetical protein